MRYSTLLLGASALVTSVYAGAPEKVAGMHMVWSDDFSGSGNFNKDKWQYYDGAITNGEQESYPKNGDFCKLSGSGSLLITPENNGGKWSSCRIETKASWTPPKSGKIQVQARFKLGGAGKPLQGVWPAFWSLGDSMRHGTPWPACGEIDTFEAVSGKPTGYGTLHCGKTCNGFSGLSQGTPFDYGSFHTWAHVIDISNGDWHQQTITFFLDGKPYHVIKGSDLNNEDDWNAVAHKAMYITLNVAIGGSWPGPVGANTASGKDANMEVQYVAVYSS